MTRLILGSQSPRRVQLLTQIGLQFEQITTAVDESRRVAEAPAAYVERLAHAKARAALELAGATQPVDDQTVAIGADTIVVLDDEILGKPRGQIEGEQMLAKLAGRTHQVATGVAVADRSRVASRVVWSKVTFRPMSAAEINQYWRTGEGADKAGSYGIQGFGGIFVERLEGSFSAVMGLPLVETEMLLQSLNIDTWSMRGRWLKNS